MSVPVPSTPTNPDDLREQVANALADSNLREVGDDGTLVRPFSAKSPMAFAYADAALSVVNRVLEGLHAELETTRRMWEASARDNDRMAEELAEVRRQVIDERVQATQTTQELFAKWRGERDQARSERDALSTLLRGMARRVGDFRRDVVRIYDQGAFAIAAAGEDRARPSVSDQTPATPDEPRRLADALELIEEMHGYVPAYFADKWQINERIAALRSTAPSSVQGDTTPKEA